MGVEPSDTGDDATEAGGAATAAASGGTPASAPSLGAGDVIDGKYALIRKVGAGAMGEVWEARHEMVGRALALKVVLQEDRATSDPEASQRLLREAQLLARIEHPNVVHVTDAGTIADGRPYYVMDLLAGRSLKHILADEGGLPWPRARYLVQQIAEALDAAHRAGVLHRDLKPANVFVVGQGPGGEIAKLIDFGIARSLTLDDEARRLTKTGALFGTPAYMSPEQARGRPLDARSDVYSLGCLMYELLTGRRPFDGASVAEILAGHLFRRPDPLGIEALPEELDALVMQCLDKEPAARPQDVASVVSALSNATGTQRRTVAAEYRPAPPTGQSLPEPDGLVPLPALEDRPTQQARLPVGGWVGIAMLSFAGALGALWWVSREPVNDPDAGSDTPPQAPASVAAPTDATHDNVLDPVDDTAPPAQPAESAQDGDTSTETDDAPHEDRATNEPASKQRSANGSGEARRGKRARRRKHQEPTPDGAEAGPDSKAHEPLPSPPPRRREDGTFDLFGDGQKLVR